MLRLLNRSSRSTPRQVSGESLLGVRSALSQATAWPEASTATAGDFIARDDRWLIGAVAAAYRERYGLSETQLAQRLGIEVEQLFWLQLRIRPVPSSVRFESEVRRLAHTFQCDEDELTAILHAWEVFPANDKGE